MRLIVTTVIMVALLADLCVISYGSSTPPETGVVTTSAPTYVPNSVQPLSLDTAGNLRTVGSGGGGGVTVSPLPLPVIVVSASPVPIAPNTSGSISNNASVTTTASTFTAPANAVGFLLESESSNTDNIRWAVGSTATASVGILSEPGRDSGFIPTGANISVISLSGTQSIGVQWVVH